ncbi:hypothetical protein JCM5353_001291 [Sporobolomyces roseus]
MEASRTLIDDGNHPWTRQWAAQKLLGVVQRLSEPAFIYRYFDGEVKRGVVEALRGVRVNLQHRGNKTTAELVSTAIETLTSTSIDAPATLATRADTIRSLLDAVLSLSNPTSSFPLPNQHLPTEILCLILDHVAQEPDMYHRRSTLRSLVSTSTDWRKIALPTWNSQVIITSCAGFNRWKDSDRYKALRSQSGGLDSLYVNLSNDPVDEIDSILNKWVHEAMAFEVRSLHLDLAVDEFNFPIGSMYWYEWANGIMTRSENQFLKMPAWTDLNYDDAFYVFSDWNRGDGCRKELYLGLGTAPVELDMEALEEGLDEVASGSGHSVFTSYSVLSAPFLPFTVPTFLCESQSSDADFDLSPSRLEHLEISLGFDPSDLSETARQVDAFFAMISPRIERLSLRLRPTRPHLSPLDEMTFTNHFFAGLRSCRRLTRLELGGFGLADNFLNHLAALPLKTLILHPIYPCTLEWR